MSEVVAQQWREVEISLTGHQVSDPYLDVDLVVDFVHESGQTVTRPAFWDGDRTWRVRFASPRADGSWRWVAHGASVVSPATGQLVTAPAEPGGRIEIALGPAVVRVGADVDAAALRRVLEVVRGLA